MSIGRDGIAGLVLLAISLVLLVKSFQLPSLPIVPVGPGFYPSIVLSFMTAASALLVLQDLLKHRAPAAPDAGETVDAPRRNYRIVAIAFAIVAGYVVLLPLLGFRLATVLFVGVLQAALDRPRSARQWTVLAAIALGAAMVSYFIFERYLLVLLPRGAWTGF